MTHTPRAVSPPDLEAIAIGRQAEVAGGVPAVASSLREILRETGIVRGIRASSQMNQKGGFDCPGCAWPDPDDERSHFEFCENGIKAIAEEATRAVADRNFFASHSVKEIAEQTDHWIGKRGRIAEPMLLERGATHYRPVSWNEAFEIIGEELRSLATPDEAIFYTSGRTSNEAAFLYQLFVREYGTNNLPDCSNMCHESSGAAMLPTIGVGKGTVRLDDFEKAELIIVIGQNPGTNHPRMLTALQDAKRRGTKIISINPLREAGLVRFKHPQEVRGVVGSGTEITDLWLPVRINGDVALLKGIMREILDRADAGDDVLDEAFIAAHTEGFDLFARALREVPWERIERESGIRRDQIREAAAMVMRTDRIIVCWAMGLTQHRNAVSNIQEIVNLLLMRGSVGKPGAGACPVRGHSNVQGDRTMGIWERPRPEFLDALDREFGIVSPRAHGLDTVEAIHAMEQGRAKVFIAMGGNFLSATPDTHRTAAALRRCSLTVHVSTKLNRAHCVTGSRALILPPLGRTESDVQASGEQFVSVENSMGIVHTSRGRLRPISKDLRSEPAIVAGMARATLGSSSRIAWETLVADYDRIRSAIERVIPGFERYNERVRDPGGFYLPNSARERDFRTTSGKAQFTVHEIEPLQLQPGQLVMMTIRSHDQYNTTIYGLDDRYRGVFHGRRVVFVNEADMRERHLEAKEEVDLVSHFQNEQRRAERFAVVPYEIPRGCIATYFPEGNELVPMDDTARVSNTPASKSVIVTIAKRR
jgi:molybdopterin-dependent oxidoreductase alpha subunit